MQPSGRSSSISSATWMLIVLTAINVCNAMDRTLISVLLPNIKNELHISDSQIGFLTGAAFALFYASLGLPLGWLAERVNRTRLISVALVTWSAMTAASGFATSFLALMALRVGVAVGEAGGSPPSYGMIADSFARTNRTFAMAVFTSAGAIGGFLALFVGGWIDQFWGWRVAFFAAGAFGLALLPFILLTVRDPQRGHSDGNTGVQVQVTVRNAAARLSSSRAFKHLVIGGTLSAFVVYSLAIWLPSFLSRSFALKSGEIGTWLGLITLFTGLMGTFSGGELARRMGARNLAWWGWTPVIGFSIAGPATVLAIMSYDLYVCLAALALSHFGVCFYMGPLFASVGTIVPPGMRSIASSALLFVQMILGLGLGPLLTGMVSDAATKSFGVEALRYALLLPTAAMVWAAFHYWMAARTIGEESASAIGDAPYAPNVIQKEQPA